VTLKFSNYHFYSQNCHFRALFCRFTANQGEIRKNTTQSGSSPLGLATFRK
jgi:hypothetical protein